MDCVRMRLQRSDWSRRRTNPYLINQRGHTCIDCLRRRPIRGENSPVGGPCGWEGRGVGGHSDPLIHSVGVCLWGRAVGVRSRRAVVHLRRLPGGQKETPIQKKAKNNKRRGGKITAALTEDSHGDDFFSGELLSENDCATTNQTTTRGREEERQS